MKPWFTVADVLTALRLPLAVVFPFLREPAAQLAVVAVAAASDFFDGILARRFGGSRVGPFIDPVADKAFMVSAFVVVATRGGLHPLEIAAVLLKILFEVLRSEIFVTVALPRNFPGQRAADVALAEADVLGMLSQRQILRLEVFFELG